MSVGFTVGFFIVGILTGYLMGTAANNMTEEEN